MKKILFPLSFLFLSLFSIAQKTVYDENAQLRQVSSFHAVHVSNAFEVTITQGNEESLAVSAAEKEFLENIKTEVSNGVLKIWFDQKAKWFMKNRKLKAYISVKNLDELKAGGACNVKIDGSLKASTMKLDLSGASKLKGNMVIAGTLNADLNGASDAIISGSASDVTIEASGASDMRAYEFTTTVCNVKASGASDVQITVDKELSVKASGASSVYYKGTALIKDIKTSGASSISRKS